MEMCEGAEWRAEDEQKQRPACLHARGLARVTDRMTRPAGGGAVSKVAVGCSRGSLSFVDDDDRYSSNLDGSDVQASESNV